MLLKYKKKKLNLLVRSNLLTYQIVKLNLPFISSSLETALMLSGVGGGKEGVAGGAGEAKLLTGDGTLIILGAC
jgi:hypothetical protein